MYILRIHEVCTDGVTVSCNQCRDLNKNYTGAEMLRTKQKKVTADLPSLTHYFSKLYKC